MNTMNDTQIRSGFINANKITGLLNSPTRELPSSLTLESVTQIDKETNEFLEGLFNDYKNIEGLCELSNDVIQEIKQECKYIVLNNRFKYFTLSIRNNFFLCDCIREGCISGFTNLIWNQFETVSCMAAYPLTSKMDLDSKRSDLLEPLLLVVNSIIKHKALHPQDVIGMKAVRSGLLKAGRDSGYLNHVEEMYKNFDKTYLYESKENDLKDDKPEIKQSIDTSKYDNGYSISDLAKEFSCSKNLIYKIIEEEANGSKLIVAVGHGRYAIRNNENKNDYYQKLQDTILHRQKVAGKKPKKYSQIGKFNQ